jgi:acetoin:2,6-dichlorophenolindophenol oxidoreductase subunit alpha
VSDAPTGVPSRVAGAAGSLPGEMRARMYRAMLEIRHFEDRVFDLFAEGRVAGSTHLGQGQEAVSVGACLALRPDDLMVCTYRGHAACLAKGMGLREAMAEILGRATGCCGGKGGSMHLTDVSVGAMGSFAIVGAGIPVACGLAWAAQHRGTGQVVACFFGDGATNIGAFHEGLNLASVWRLPAVFVCENNLYGEYTPIAETTPVADVAVRAGAYAMPGVVVDGNDVEAVYSVVGEAAARARAGEGPTLLEAKTYRQKGHSRGDPATYRPPGELGAWLERDPISRLRLRLVDSGTLSEAEAERIAGEAKAALAAAEAAALADPFPGEAALVRHVYAEEF